MSPEEFDSALGDLETRVDRLRALYENWFRGYEKSEPSVARKEVERRVYQMRKELPRNTALRFRYHQLYQRYTTLATYWQRTARQIEEGTYKLQLTRLKRRNEGRPQRRERREGEEEKEGPKSFELNLDESLSVDDLLNEHELDEVARALDAPGLHGAAPEPSSARAEQSFGKPGGTGTMTMPKPALAEPAGAAKPGPAPFGGMPGAGKLPGPTLPTRPGAPGAAAARDPGQQVPASAPAAQSAPTPAAATAGAAAKPAPLVPGAARPAPPGAAIPAVNARPGPPAPPPPAAPAARPGLPVATVPQGGTLAGIGRPLPPRPNVPPPPARAEAAPGTPPRPAAPPVPQVPAVARPAVPVVATQREPTAASAPRPAAPVARPAAPIAPSSTIVGRPPVASPIAGSGLNEQRMKRIYDEYAAARRRNNEGEIRYEALVGSIQKMLPELSKKHQGKQIDFDVVVKDGRVGLKPKAT